MRSKLLIFEMQRIAGVLFILLSLMGKAQTPTTIAYSHDYEFKEGVYLTIEQFLGNNPILKSKIVSDIPKTQIDFLTQLLEHKTFTTKDTSGAEHKIETNSIWGYCQNRTIYFYFNNEFIRLNVIGNLSLFSGIVVHSTTHTEPIGDMYAIEPSFEELHQFVLDTRSDKVLDFDSENMEMILKNDAELYAQFMKLKKRAKANSIFIYLRKYNEKYPLYLPSN